MHHLSTDTVTLACRLFFSLAYPAGEDSIPSNRRCFRELPANQEWAEYLTQHPLPANLLQTIRDPEGLFRGYALRLGSGHFPHLKLKLEWLTENEQPIWIFAVDTHDAFSKESRRPPPDHPDAAAWSQLQITNGQLKEKIEAAWEAVGLVTFKALLRNQLQR